MAKRTFLTQDELAVIACSARNYEHEIFRDGDQSAEEFKESEALLSELETHSEEYAAGPAALKAITALLECIEQGMPYRADEPKGSPSRIDYEAVEKARAVLREAGLPVPGMVE